MTPLRIEAAAIAVTFGDERILDGVDLQLAAGELVCVAGPSGSGKTTLLGAISGALRHDGRAHLCSDRDRRPVAPGDVAWIFQHSRADAALAAWELVAAPLLLDEHGAETARTIALDVMASLGVGGRADVRFNRLSGGERQRVAIAQAIVNPRPLILADEPTAALDRTSTQSALVALRDHLVDRFALLASHDPLVWSSADRVVHLDRGRIVGT
jgi:putative ABC transport system ATP-binding protein